MNKPQPLSDRAKNFIQMEARGVPRDVILQEIFHLPPGCKDKTALNKADSQMHRWRNHPYAKQYWDAEIAATIKAALPSALKTLISQSQDHDGEVKKGWLANKASNDVMSIAKSFGIVDTADSTVNVKVQGLPELGKPEDD